MLGDGTGSGSLEVFHPCSPNLNGDGDGDGGGGGDGGGDGEMLRGTIPSSWREVYTCQMLVGKPMILFPDAISGCLAQGALLSAGLGVLKVPSFPFSTSIASHIVLETPGILHLYRNNRVITIVFTSGLCLLDNLYLVFFSIAFSKVLIYNYLETWALSVCIFISPELQPYPPNHGPIQVATF